MKTTLTFICLSLLFFGACKKKNNSTQSEKKGSPNFNFSSGWKLVQTVTSDLETSGIAVMGYHGFDFGGTNNNVRCMYFQGWTGQQGFLYSNNRLDEFDAQKNRVARKELTFENNYISVYHGLGIETSYMLRNGKTTVLTQAKVGSGIKWQVYENGVLAGEEKDGHFSYAIGQFMYGDDNRMDFYDSYFDGVNKLWFYYKQYQNGPWKLFPQTSFTGTNCKLIGADIIHDTAYAFISNVIGDSTRIEVLRYDSVSNWIRVKAATMPWKGDWVSSCHPTFLPNHSNPVFVFENSTEMRACEFDLNKTTILSRGISDKISVYHSNLASFKNIVLVNNEIYFAYVDGSLPYVAKLTATGPKMVGSGALVYLNYPIDLEVRNNTLYAVVFNKMVNKEQIYIATPQ